MQEPVCHAERAGEPSRERSMWGVEVQRRWSRQFGRGGGEADDWRVTSRGCVAVEELYAWRVAEFLR